VNDWGDFIPEWIEQNRTGPGPLAPRYAEKGMAMGKWKGDSNPGGPGGRTRKVQTNKARGKTSHRSGGGGGGKKNDCCPMVAAVRSVKRGQFRLARRYAVMSIRLLVARVA
jgi:hypothetical protein